MKITFPILSAFLAASVLLGCSKSGSNTTPIVPPPTPVPTEQLKVSFSNSQISADGFDETTIVVKDQANNDITSTATIYVNNVAQPSNVFFTSSTGTYQVKATKGTLESAVVTLSAVTPGPSQFTQKVFAEFFTGTWCGICPGTLIPFNDYSEAHPNLVGIGVHGPNGSGDPYTYAFDAQLRQALGVGGVPTVILNRDGAWNGANSSLDALAAKRAALGLALETSVTGSTIGIKAKVKFDVSTSIPMKLVVMLVEDNLRYNQSNYGHYGLPNPIQNFNHRNVLRSAATDVFGDAIPTTEQTKGNTWEKSLSISAGSYPIANLRVIGFVVFGTNSQGRKGVLNVQVVNAGQVKNFD